MNDYRRINDGKVKYVDGIYNESVFMDKFAIRDIRKSLKDLPKVTLSKHAEKQLYKNKTIKHLGRAINKEEVVLSKLKRDNHIVEFYTRDNLIYKYVVRVSLTKELDMCVVIIPRIDINLVVTVWTNNKTDNHNTTNKSKYITKRQHFNKNIK